MNAQDFRNQILMKKPRYAESRIPVINAFANKGQSKSEYSQFGPVYELYIYAFILGLKKGLKLPLPTRKLTKDFVEIAKWKRDSSLVDFLLMIIFSHSEELGLDWSELEELDEKDLNSKVNDVIEFIESYANGGLEFIQQEHMADNLEKSPYLFVDLLAQNTTFQSHSEQPSLEASEVSEELEDATLRLIDLGESPNTEFKSTLRVNLHTNAPDSKMEHSCMKTLAGFMNTKSGTLLIGVSDKKEILGLEIDFNSFSKKDDLLDEFQKHLDNIIESYFGNAVISLINLSFPEVKGKMICRLDVEFSKKGPVYLKNRGTNSEEFYIRRSASTKALNASEMIGYIENHWQTDS